MELTIMGLSVAKFIIFVVGVYIGSFCMAMMFSAYEKAPAPFLIHFILVASLFLVMLIGGLAMDWMSPNIAPEFRTINW